MSRIIVKNLPKNIKEDRIRSLFGEIGPLTDCSLKYTKEGVFRRFAFIGYTGDDVAEKAVKHFNQSFIDTSRLIVEIARELGDGEKPRAWSKYSKDSTAYQRTHKTSESCADTPKKTKKIDKELKKKSHLDELLGDLKNDAEFQEFLEVNKVKTGKNVWGNDDLAGTSKQGVGQVEQEASDEDSMEVDESDVVSSEKEEELLKPKLKKKKEKVPKKEQIKVANEKISDLEYIKSKQVAKASVFSDSESDSDSESGEGSEAESEDNEKALKEKQKEEEDKSDSESPKPKYRFLVKMKGIPPSSKEAQIREFFKPITLVQVKIPHGSKANKSQIIATVEFASKEDQEQALSRNKNFIGPKRIFLHKFTEEIPIAKEVKSRQWEIKTGQDQDEETIAESGRLYVRNLAYCCKEEDLESLFAKYGPLSEVHLPIDTFTKKIKGFAFVTFMFPEHAVKAFADLDGKSWQGRILHILPSKVKSTSENNEGESSYKKKKNAEQKATAGSSHNWNTLFLGANAVVDVMSNQYSTSKSHILGVSGGKESVGVRLALGETQIVSETRGFLVENGVVLDAFSKPGTERSKTVMIVKNLPANTQAEELEAIFSRHGTLGRLVLPPSGVSAIVEFIEPTEAKTAFRSLAYTKFKHLPLYLEWAPMDVFSAPPEKPDKKCAKSDDQDEDSKDDGEESEEEGSGEKDSKAEESDDESTDTSEGCTLFVKNLNFDTEDDALRIAFAKCGKIKSATVAKKKDLKHPGKMLSMGYGFVEYRKPESAQKALKTLQHVKVDGHQLELKLSNRSAAPQSKTTKKSSGSAKQVSTKILVRNLPFEAKQNEVKELFSVFGELKTVRLPKKLSGGKGQHRGFGFVDFLSKEDAKRAFSALCHSTHLYGRRLVLEWAAEDESVDELRLRTASRFSHGQGPASKKLKKGSLMEELKLAEAD